MSKKISKQKPSPFPLKLGQLYAALKARTEKLNQVNRAVKEQIERQQAEAKAVDSENTAPTFSKTKANKE